MCGLHLQSAFRSGIKELIVGRERETQREREEIEWRQREKLSGRNSEIAKNSDRYVRTLFNEH